MSFSGTVTRVVETYTQLETSIGAVSRLKAFGDGVASEALQGEVVAPPDGWPHAGAVEIKDISASYLGDEDLARGTPNFALKSLTLSISPGEKVAICGRTGSGKSSIILLLLRLLDPIGSRNGDRSQENLGDINDENTLSIDGLSLRHVDRAALRRAVITVPQDPAFLPGGSTVRQNLDPLDAASDEDCAAVLARVGLSDLLLPGSGGLGRGMSADSLSAGQQRLFALAGAVLRAHVKRKASSRCGTSGGGGLLLLDEVNFATDEDTERKIRDVIRHEFADYTVIMVSHQLGLVVDLCQRVVVLDRGAVVEQGDPAQLSKQLGSRFGRLWEAQRQERK